MTFKKASEIEIHRDTFWDDFPAWLAESEEIVKKIEARAYPPEVAKILMEKAIRPYVYFHEDAQRHRAPEPEPEPEKKGEPATAKQIETINRWATPPIIEMMEKKYGTKDPSSLTKGQAMKVLDEINEKIWSKRR